MKRAAASLLIIALLYFMLLLWGDFRKQFFSELPKLLSIMPILIGFCLASIIIRFLRWRWLFQRAEVHIRPIFIDFLIYVSGFAFTATPGKVGELVRVRYYMTFHIPPSQVVSAFVYERTFDLISVLFLACFAITRMDIFLIATAFVCIFVGLILLFIVKDTLLLRVADYLKQKRFYRLSDLCMTLREAMVGCRVWLTPQDICFSFLFGLLAWGVQSAAFIVLLQYIGISVPLLAASAIFPLATLAGAASMLPGGIGSTEAVFAALLALHGAGIAISTIAIVGIRVSSIWFSIILGICASVYLEMRQEKYKKHTVS